MTGVEQPLGVAPFSTGERAVSAAGQGQSVLTNAPTEPEANGATLQDSVSLEDIGYFVQMAIHGCSTPDGSPGGRGFKTVLMLVKLD